MRVSEAEEKLLDRSPQKIHEGSGCVFIDPQPLLLQSQATSLNIHALVSFQMSRQRANSGYLLRRYISSDALTCTPLFPEDSAVDIVCKGARCYYITD